MEVSTERRSQRKSHKTEKALALENDKRDREEERKRKQVDDDTNISTNNTAV